MKGGHPKCYTIVEKWDCKNPLKNMQRTDLIRDTNQGLTTAERWFQTRIITLIRKKTITAKAEVLTQNLENKRSRMSVLMQRMVNRRRKIIEVLEEESPKNYTRVRFKTRKEHAMAMPAV